MEDGQSELPQPFDYYVNVITQAYDFIKENPEQVEKLREEYVTFSENLLDYINKKDKQLGKGSNDHFFYSDILEKQKEIVFGEDVDMEDLTSNHSAA